MTTGSANTRRHEHGRDAGFTLVEMVVTTMILGIVLATLYAVLFNVITNEGHQQARVTNQEAVRLALIELGQDIRAADPLLAPSSLTEIGTTVEMQLGDGADAAWIRWSHVQTPSAPGRLVRQELDGPDGTVVNSRDFLTGIVDNIDAGVPVFEYFDEEGRELTAATDTVDDVANCTIRIRVTVTNVEDEEARAFTETKDVHLRNRLPGGSYGCTEV